MKKGAIKYIVGASLVAFGIILVIIASCIGGASVFNTFKSGFYINSSGIHINGSDDYTDKEDSVMNSGSIKNLKVDFDYGEMVIRTGNVEEIKVETQNINQNRFKYRVDGDTLDIGYDRGWSIGFLGFSVSSRSRIEITVPESMTFEKVEIDNGAGKMTVEGITADRLNVENGAGDMTINSVTVTDRLDIDGGVGAIFVSDTVCGGIDADIGVGQLTFTGEVNGDGKIDSGVGAVHMTLYGDRSDYDFRTDSGIGQVITPGSNSGAKYTFNVSSGVGEVRITMEERK